ncbi:YeeE/YedE family protein [Saccharopolyspora halophila]|uniref:YeeE/YedE family protein n=1 Tax=Saccharopolyspora halophila TaxID=405551 RepID=A0ABP5TLR7_9PSEU
MSVVDGSRSAPPQVRKAAPAQRGTVAVGIAVAAVLALAVANTAGWKLTLLFGVGIALGLALFHSRFGFTSAWRQLVTVGQGRALRAHMLMLAVACVLFAVVLGAGASLSGTPEGLVKPTGLGVVLGAFLFGVGMQVGGSCASGTLFAVGSGQTAILFTLGGFIVGSVISAFIFPWITAVQNIGPTVSLADTPLGYPGALLISLVLIAGVVGISLLVERRRTPPPMDQQPSAQGLWRVLRGTWPVWVGALVLAGLNALTLFISGGPWGITSAFVLWGSKLLGLVGIDISGAPYWQDPDNAATLAASVLADKTSVMNFGIMIGALIAAALAGGFTLHRKIPLRLAVGAVIGGILMGIGARFAGGCNIGAYFSGIASFSLHGWLWGLVAIAGTYAGIALRPLFGLGNPKPSDAVC